MHRFQTRETYRTSVVVKLKVSLLLSSLGRLGLREVRTLAKMVVIQFLLEGLIRGLGEHALLLQDGHDTHRL